MYKITMYLDNEKEYTVTSDRLNKFEEKLYNEMALGSRVLINGLRHFELEDGNEVWINPSHISCYEVEEIEDKQERDMYYSPDYEAFLNGEDLNWFETEGINLNED